MSDAMTPREGGCRCGHVRFRITAAPLVTMACHCRGCQQMSASAFSLSVAIPVEAFAVIAGEPVQGGKPSPDLTHFHCPDCKSWLFTRMAGMDMFVNVRSAQPDAPGAWAIPFVETYTSEKLPWAATPARHSFAAFPPLEAWEGLAQAYRVQAERAAEPPSSGA